MTFTAIETEEFKMTEIGLLPSEWTAARLVDHCSFVRGTEPGSNSYNRLGKGRAFIRVGNIAAGIQGWVFTTSPNVRTCAEEDILMTFDGSPGVVVKGYSGAYSSGIRKMVPLSKIDRGFLYYVLQTQYVQGVVEEHSTGVTIKHAGKALPHIVIPLPPLPEQKKIAYVLSTVQNVVEKTEAVIKAARALKKSLMKHLFTYGPVSIDEAESVLLKETEIGLVPEGWEVVRLDEVITEGIRNGAFVRRSNFGNGVIFLNVADTYSNVSADLRVSERVQCTDEEFRLYEIKPGDLFYVRSSLKREGVGQCCVVEHIPEPSIYDCHLMRVRVDDERVIPKFLAYYSVSLPGKLSLISRSKTTTMTTINQRGLAYFVVPLPPIPTQREIANTLTTVDDKIQSEENKRQALEALFKTLLSSLMTGKIRVSSLEAPV